jgi:hypothetical protein
VLKNSCPEKFRPEKTEAEKSKVADGSIVIKSFLAGVEFEKLLYPPNSR